MSVRKWLNDHNLAVSAVGVCALVLLLYMTRISLYVAFHFPYLKLESGTKDWIYQLGKTAPKDPRIVFLYDDAASHRLDHLWDEDFDAAPILKKMKQTGERAGVWPREVFAAILDRLSGAGARVVGFDYVFQDERPDSDPVFKDALDRNRDRVVVGSQLDLESVGNQNIPSLKQPAKTLIAHLEDPRVGFVNVFPDADEVVRRFPFRITREEMAGKPAPPDATEYESLPVRMLKQAKLGQQVPADRTKHLIRFAYKGETRQDMNRPESVANIFVQSYWDANYKNGEYFRDKVVLVGPAGSLYKDVAESPFQVIGGPEFHLNVMNALLTGSFLSESPFELNVLLIFAAGGLTYAAGKLIRNPVLRALAVIALGAGYFALAVWIYDHQNVVVPVFSPLLGLIGSSSVGLLWQQLIERLEKARLRKTFERYVSRDVVKELLDNPASYLNTMGGVRKNVTILFSDVRGFTTITESGDAQALVQQLNEYFDHMVNLVFANHGTLDKFIGDAVMAQWGGIYTEGEKQDAINAVRTAVQMRKRLAELNQRWLPAGKIELKFGIGVNHGEAIVGNLGCEAKMEVSLIGDAVNTASRFEGMTKQFHLDMLIGGSVEQFIRDDFHVRTVALTLPKGKTKPVEVFTVVEDKAVNPAPPAWLPVYEEGVRLYRQRSFSAAIECFEKVLQSLPDDWLTADYLAVCRAFAAEPPPADWNGVNVMTSK